MIDVLHGKPTAALDLGVMGLGIIGLVVLIAIVVGADAHARALGQLLVSRSQER